MWIFFLSIFAQISAVNLRFPLDNYKAILIESKRISDNSKIWYSTGKVKTHSTLFCSPNKLGQDFSLWPYKLLESPDHSALALADPMAEHNSTILPIARNATW